MGCAFVPEDFKEKITYKLLLEVLRTGLVSINNYWGNPEVEDDEDYSDIYYFPKMRNLPDKFNNGCIIEDNYFGRCCILTENGCPLSFNYRPYEAKSLIPKETENDKCKEGISKKEYTAKWIPYKRILDQLVDDLYNKKVEVDFENTENVNKRIKRLKSFLKGE